VRGNALDHQTAQIDEDRAREAYTSQDENLLPSTSEWTSSLTSSIDDLLNSLHLPSEESQRDSQIPSESPVDPSNKAASPESSWFAGLTEQEQRVMQKLALFEGRVQALKNMREELY
jgi:hypothetical protein